MQAIERSAVRVTRREIRAIAGLSETAVRIHSDRLVDLEYLVPHAGRNGQRFSYELAFDGDVSSDAPQAVGLFDIGPVTTANLAGLKADLAPTSQAACTHLAPTSPGVESVDIAHTSADLSSLVAALAVDALPEEPRAVRRNGASYPER